METKTKRTIVGAIVVNIIMMIWWYGYDLVFGVVCRTISSSTTRNRTELPHDHNDDDNNDS